MEITVRFVRFPRQCIAFLLYDSGQSVRMAGGVLRLLIGSSSVLADVDVSALDSKFFATCPPCDASMWLFVADREAMEMA